jgi:hypothetical protein
MADHNSGGSRLVNVVTITAGGDWYFFDPTVGPSKIRENLFPVTVFALAESKLDENDHPYKRDHTPDVGDKETLGQPRQRRVAIVN